MTKAISVLVRDGKGPLRIAMDREAIAHTDDHQTIESVLGKHRDAGDDMVLILADDDSVLRHWTRPVEDLQAKVEKAAPKTRRVGKATKVAKKKKR